MEPSYPRWLGQCPEGKIPMKILGGTNAWQAQPAAGSAIQEPHRPTGSVATKARRRKLDNARTTWRINIDPPLVPWTVVRSCTNTQCYFLIFEGTSIYFSVGRGASVHTGENETTATPNHRPGKYGNPNPGTHPCPNPQANRDPVGPRS